MNGSSIGTTNAVVLNDGRSAGQQGFESIKITPAANPNDPPMVTMDSSMITKLPATQADTVAVFGCNSIDLASQYGNTNFVGIDSGTDKLSSIEASDEAAAAFLASQVTAQDPLQSANAAFQQNARVTPDVNDKDGDTIKQAEKTDDKKPK